MIISLTTDLNHAIPSEEPLTLIYRMNNMNQDITKILNQALEPQEQMVFFVSVADKQVESSTYNLKMSVYKIIMN